VKQARTRLTYANVMSTIAVFLVLGGATAFAATQLAKNSVGSAQIKKNAVTAAKVKNAAITSAKLANASVSNAKLADASVSSAKLADASVSNAKLADGSVIAGKLGDGAVTSGKLAANAVTAGKIVDGSITNGKLLDEAVNASKLTKSPFQLGSSVSAAANSVSSIELECTAGTKMLSGGVLNSNKELKMLGTYPNTESKWKIVMYNESGGSLSYSPIVLCLK